MWFWFAILSALVSAISIILNKKALKNINASLVSWSLFAFSIPILAYPAFKNGWPKLNTVFWIAITASVISFAYAKTLTLKSLKGSLMSEIILLAFFMILFNYLFGVIFLSETLRLIPIIGLILIIIGGYFLKVKEDREDIFKPFKLLLINKNSRAYLLAMIIIPLVSVFDKYGLKNIQPVNQSFLLLMENFMTAVLIGFYMTKKNRRWIIDLKDNFWSLFLNGIVYTFVSLLFLYGITTGVIALVSGVKKLEVFFVLILGWFLFNDKPKKEVWIGSLIMLVGVVLIKLS
jgi:uncharacterized membrane protein